jgi:hypothetical protein
VKVAHTAFGLALNLHEMALWSAFPESFQRHLTPCLDLSPELILTQRRVQVIGPPLIAPGEDRRKQQEEAHRLFADRIYACRAGLGLESDPNSWGGSAPTALRLDNFGVHEGRVVMIDYGDQLPPAPGVWARLLGTDEPPTFRSLCERAGLNSDNTEACPCYCGGTWSEPGWFPHTCLLDADVADFLAELTMTAAERPAA